MRDAISNISPVAAVAPAVLSATNTSEPVDIRGYDAVALIISTGAIAGAGDFTAKLQESETTTSGDFSDVVAADLSGAFPATLEAATVYKVGYLGKRPYLRTVLTKNSGTSIAAGAIIERSHPRAAPVA